MSLLYMNGFDHFGDGGESFTTMDYCHPSMTLPAWGNGRFGYGRYLQPYNNWYQAMIGRGKLDKSTLYMGFALMVD